MSELFSVLDTLATEDVHAMAEPRLLVSIEELLIARDRLDGVLAVRLQAADARQVTAHECGRTTRSWLVEEAHLAPEAAGRWMGLARALPFYPSIRSAVLAGEISHDHARVIAGCLRRLPAQWCDAAEAELVDAARQVDPVALGELCRELRLRSGADEDAEAAAQRIYDARWATVSRTFEGMTHLEAMLDPESGATLVAALAPLVAPAGAIDPRRVEQRRADALVELAEFSLTHAELSDHTGERPQVTVTIPWSELRDEATRRGLGNATISGNIPITPRAARMLACDARVIPAVLGAEGEVLDLGRSTPTWSRAQRRARRLVDRGCTFPKCQAGLDRCQIHHLRHWALGGPTDVTNGAHLCRFHHWLVHHTGWTISRNTHGRIEVRRT